MAYDSGWTLFAGASMDLLATKLYIPPARPGILFRSRLSEQLNPDALKPLTLISAPAGYGKTTLLSTWAYNCGQAVAWLSLDEGDNDPARFWRYVDAAFQKVDCHLGEKLHPALHSLQPPAFEQIVTGFVNDIMASGRTLILVLEDYHVINNTEIHTSVNFLLDNVPPNLHVMITTRSDPPLHLALRRGRGLVAEIRAADLRFTPDETAVFINETMRLGLTADDLTSLAQRTEGWIAGLQMAALSLQAEPDPHAFVSAFSGDNRHIADYLIEEVLQRQPIDFQRFLLQTSIFEQMSAPLCNAVLGRQDSQAMLNALERANLFIQPLDDQRHLFRYHHLFSNLLQNRLKLSLPDEIISLHHKASQWYEHNGLIKEAIEHSLLAQNYDRAILLINQAAEHFFGYGDRTVVARWIHTIPEEHLRKNLNLEVLRAASLTMDGHIQEAETCIQNVEKWLMPMENPDKQQTILEGRILTVHSNIAAYRGDLDAILFYAPQALEKLAEDIDLTWRSWNLVNLSNVSVSRGDIDAAIQYLIDGIAAGKATHSPDMVLTTMFYRILVLWLKGSIREAGQASQEGLEHIAENHLHEMPRAGALFMMWGLILCERHELKSAEKSINQGYNLIQLENSPLWLELANLIRLRFLIARGDLLSADCVAKEAIHLFSEYEIPEMLAAWIRGFITWLWVLQGRFPEVEKDFQDHKICIDGEVIHPYYSEYLSLARLLQARKGYSSSIDLLGRIIHRAETDKQFRWAVSGYMLLALAHKAQGDVPHAVRALEKALGMTEPEGNLQIFVDEGETMQDLLSRVLMGLHNDQSLAVYVKKILSAFEPVNRKPKQAVGLVEPLTEREMEVLRYMAEGLSNPEIAHCLYLSPNTLKAHAQNIFMKLGVHNRLQAVNRAKELLLID